MMYLLLAITIISTAVALHYWQRSQRMRKQLTTAKFSHEQLELLLGQSNSILILMTPEMETEYLHSAHAAALGFNLHTVLPNWAAPLRNEALNQIRQGLSWHGELKVPSDKGDSVLAAAALPVLDKDQVLRNIIVKLDNITDHKKLADRLFVQQHYNSLTDLPNRHHALIQLSRSIRQCRAQHSEFMLLHIDLDRIHFINDTLGHQIVDQLFIETASRLRRSVREGQILAHLGADEFLIILEEQSCVEEAAILAEVILERLREPYRILQHDISITASIGTAQYPQDATDAATLMRRAEAAMFEAKRQGGNRFCHFKSDLSGQLVQRVEIESQLRQAIAKDELALYFQPLIDARSNTLCAAEVLLRWRNNALNNPGPDQFIPIAEETGLIVEIGEWVLLNACKQAVAWRREGLPNIKIAINISARQFEDQAILDCVQNALKQSGLPASQLELEITEGLLINDSEEIHQCFMALKGMGVQMSLDDFGTGYASLSYLKRYPFDILKIDRCFVHDIDASGDSLTLVNAIIAMAHSFDMQVVAEGVETPQHRRLLADRGCDFLQGYLYSPPLAAERFSEWMRRENLASAPSPHTN